MDQRWPAAGNHGVETLTVARRFVGRGQRGSRALRILLLEGGSGGAEPVRARLSEGDIPCELERVETRADFVAALEKGGFDLILADYTLPGFDGLSALEMTREIRPGVPCILLSDTSGEEDAVETIKSGAADYVLKHRLERLVPAVRRAIHEAQERSERAEEKIRQSQERFRIFAEEAVEGIVLVEDGKILDANRSYTEMYGYNLGELVGMDVVKLTPPNLRGAVARRISIGNTDPYQARGLKKNGTVFSIEVRPRYISYHGRQVRATSVIDLTARKPIDRELVRLDAAPLLHTNPVIETTVAGEPTYVNPAAQERFPDLVKLGQRHPILAGLKSVDREIKESGGRPITRELWVGEAFYQQLTSPVPESDLLRLYATDVTEQHRAQEALEKSEKRFRSLVRYASDIIVILDADGVILYESLAVERVLGFRAEERVGNEVFAYVHEDDAETVRSKFVEVLDRSGGRLSVEYRSCARDGSWHHFEAIIANLLHDPIIRGIVVNTRDISDRKCAEESLRRSEDLYRTVVEQAAESIFLVDLKTKRVLEANAALHRSLGYSADELKSMSLYDVVAHDRGSVDENIGHVVAQKQHGIGERKYRHKDGSLVNVEVNASIVPYGDKQAMCIVAHDVTQRRRAEEELRHSLGILLALREAGQVLGSTLESEEIVSRLLDIMRGVAGLTSAVITRENAEGDLRVWRSAGLEALWPRIRFVPEAEEARRAVLEHQEQRLLRLQRPGYTDNLSIALYLPLKIRDRVVGVLEAYGSESLAEKDTMEVLSSLSSQAASALENAQLYEELGERERELQDLIGKLMGAQEEERRRVAYEVHDGLAQVAVAAHQHLQAFARRHPPDEERGRRDLDRILKLVRATVSDARRIIANLRPTTLDDLGLVATILIEVERLREEGYQVDYEERIRDERLPDTVEIALYRVIQEVLTNMRKHARARSVCIELWSEGGEVRLEVTDDGRGFDPDAAPLESGPGERVGLAGMRERIGTLDGVLEVRSRPGCGTSVAASVPLKRAP